MSIINLNNEKLEYEKFEKNSRVIEESLIQYIDKDLEYEMKKGYEAMAEINLEYSQIGSEYMLDDVNEYEAWICGV